MTHNTTILRSPRAGDLYESQRLGFYDIILAESRDEVELWTKEIQIKYHDKAIVAKMRNVRTRAYVGVYNSLEGHNSADMVLQYVVHLR